jgi:hypothetical protein
MRDPSNFVLKFAGILLIAALLPSMVRAEAGESITDEDLLLGGNPIVIRTRVRLGNELTDVEGGGHSDKLILSGIYGFGFNDRDRPFGIGFELPFLYNNPESGECESGVGDLKLRFGHLFVDDPKCWRAGWFFDTELDTAADDVQAIANQRTQMAIGGGGSYSFLRNFVITSALQYGWSLGDGETNGEKSEWEAHLIATLKVSPSVTLNLDYKAIINIVDHTDIFHNFEPSVGWAIVEKKNVGLSASVEIPLDETSTQWIGKAGVTWFF